jgi:glycosyltransferase involved in cell wall biosynthesis
MRAVRGAQGAEAMGPARIGFLLGGPTQFEAPFFRHAQESGGAEVTVLYLKAGPGSLVNDPELGRKVDWGFDLYAGYAHKPVPIRARIPWLWRELRPGRYDWLVINGYTALPYLAAVLIARARGIRTGLRIDSVLFNATGWRRRAMKRMVMGLLSRLFDRFFATGTMTQEYLTHFGIVPARISRFPYAVDVERFRRESAVLAETRDAIRALYGVPATARVIVSVAKFNSRESPWDLLGALEGLDRPDLFTLLVGDGQQREALCARVESRGLKNVVFAGYVPYADLASCYAIADVFVHAAGDEPWGVSVHEAIACGLPVVVSTHVGAGRDLVLQGRNGFVYSWGDAADLRSKLSLVLDTLDPEIVKRANEDILARWNYARAWGGILEACK